MKNIFGSKISVLAVLTGLIAIPAYTVAKDKKDDQPLMPTPIMYSEDHIDPFIHLPPDDLSTEMKVFYATNRNSTKKENEKKYGKGIVDTMSIGSAMIRFGDEGSTWAEIDKASMAPHPRDPEIGLYLTEVTEMASFQDGQPTGEGAKLNPGQQQFVDAINAQLEVVADKQILLYVHGAKFDFATSVGQTAEVNHFAGRDLVGVAYAWPTHKDIIAYAFGTDVRRSHHSSPILGDLIELLAAHTNAEAINILSWSAGGRVASRAISDLRQKYSSLSSEQLRKKFRLKLIFFAAADVPTDHFIARLPDMHDMTDRLSMTQSDDDSTLKFGEKTMKGGQRAGMYLGNMTNEELAKIVEPLPRFEIINVSAFKDERGFDITGHHYWFENPWVSTDVLINVRTGLAPADRALTPTGKPATWGMKGDYPKRVGEALDKIGAKSW